MRIAPAIVVFSIGLASVATAQTIGPDQINEKWKPGPKVSREIARLEHEGRVRHRAFLDGKIPLLTVIRENARLEATLDALRAWAASTRSDEPSEFAAVDVQAEGYGHVFPRGTSHLPHDLVAGDIYSAGQGSSRRWQYVGDRKVTGIRFSIFRSVSSGVETVRDIANGSSAR